MCGLVGMAGRITVKEEKVFKTLLHLDVLRGEHSTGILSVTSKDEMVLKKLGTPTDLKEYKAYDELFRRNNKILMGHNRYATQGAISAINAHPFEFPTLIGAHNGTLRNQKDLPDSDMFDVDSENLYHAIETLGLAPAIKKTRGAYSLTWYDKEEETINFLRNEERPMFMCLSEDGETMFWASEEWMLSVALGREGIKYTEILSTEEHKHYSFSIDLIKYKAKIPKPVVRHIEPALKPVTKIKKFGGSRVTKYGNVEGKILAQVSGYFKHPVSRVSDYIIMRSDEVKMPIHVFCSHGSDLWDMLRGSDAGHSFELELWELPKNGVNQAYYVAKASSITDATIEGYMGKKLSLAEFKKAVANGCGFCSETINKPSDVGDWFSDTDPICTSCCDHWYADVGEGCI